MWRYYFILKNADLQNLKRRSLKGQFFRVIESGDLKKYKLPILRCLIETSLKVAIFKVELRSLKSGDFRESYK